MTRKAHKQGVWRKLQDDAKLLVIFHLMDKKMMKKIITLTRPKLEYTAVVWSPCIKGYQKAGQNSTKHCN